MALFVDRWLRRANRASALAARRKAEAQAKMAIEREALLHRFRAASNVFAVSDLFVVGAVSVLFSSVAIVCASVANLLHQSGFQRVR